MRRLCGCVLALAILLGGLPLAHASVLPNTASKVELAKKDGKKKGGKKKGGKKRGGKKRGVRKGKKPQNAGKKAKKQARKAAAK